MRTSFLAILVGLTILLSGIPIVALEAPVVLDPAVTLNPVSNDKAKSDLRFLGQPARSGIIDLTAANGFFDRCFEALEPGPGIAGDTRFIGPTFGYLKRMSDKVPGTARWHLWVAEAGEIRASLFMTVPEDDVGHEWVIHVGNHTQILKANRSDGESAQKQTLSFKVETPGRVTFTIDCIKAPPPAESRVRFIRLEGTAVTRASLLRTRWRPAAVHARFYAPSECPAPNMWVFETQAVSKTSSYSPMTTGFGYYGTVFNAEGGIASSAGFNFSMWVAGRTATVAPPLPQMPRLIGTGIPEARYGTFGGEGTGVKFFDAVAYPDGAERTIQALRIEPTEDGLITWYGYFYDEKKGQWKLYASAQAPPKDPRTASRPDFGTMSSTGSFCEIPGPPNRERSGDLVREIKRRGWFYGKDSQWYRAVLGDVLNDEPIAPEEPDDDGSITNKRVDYLADYATEGWMSMSTGGVEYHLEATSIRKPADPKEPPPLPEYLKPEKAKQLFALPVEFGKSEARDVAADRATIVCNLKKTGPNSKAILYYGTVDCLTYPPKQVTKGSAVEIDMARPERTWQFATAEQKVDTGENRFRLAGLKPSTTYYFRLFVSHDEGKSWDYRSGCFQSK
ncbi:MAG: hypothetical protein FD180_1503 [Planctomycetota bacterium]|nr:MAG: hypothetical protein FD180_1503 [Planctomycetota bacterium]